MRNAPFAFAIALALITTSFATDAQYAYVGTYQPNGEGIYRFQVNPTDGALREKTLVSHLTNPAQLTIDARGKTLYAASESEKGVVVAYAIAKDGSLTMLNQVSSQGAGPVFLSLTPNGKFLLVANYTSGSIAVLPVLADGRLAEASDSRQHQGPVGSARPAAAAEGSFAISDHNGPHAHMIASDPSGQFVFSTDLGLDRIWQYRLTQDGKLQASQPAWIAASSAGAGPRHFVFHPGGKSLYLINEEASTLTRYLLDASSGTLHEDSTVSALPAGYKGTSFAAGLAIDKAGKHLWVANRLHNSIGHFVIEADGRLKHKDDVWTRGDYPRTLTLSADGKTLYALNQRSDNVTRFQVDTASGTLLFSGDYTAVGAPSQLVLTP
ncbi:lactonase family protein [Erwinia psidii]|uniref:Lactonase family protein n=1 Tax=Erwinia psidii TaxID=69224 RepID=A0A3N6UZ07_9GAMM|nr:lactonase family protein [Erwinia psidii]MCX8958234.1 lactonase family protein [Erwinia psidii]MCX8962376.1 lactonase family protein [Erwinia psidii]MCX8965160.1 lactonase family protein [Erwinia psidii]RQM38035.1 lactonase family protein [Erwinia psidii]